MLLKKHSKHVGRNVDEEKIFNAFSNLYRAYKDKGRINRKITELNEFMKDFNNYREKPMLVDKEKKAFIKNMVDIGVTCLRVDIELEKLHKKELELLKEGSEKENAINFSEAEESEEMMSFG